MSGSILWFAGNRKMVLWAVLAALVVSMGLYVSHLQNARDAALHTAQSLQKTLDDERTAAKAVADAKVESAKVAATTATAQVVQKKREIAQSNNDLKREINDVYQTQPRTTATAGTAQTTTGSQGNGTASEIYGNSEIGVDGTVQRRVDSGVGLNAGCFGDDFKRLWNAANTSTGGVSSTATP